MGGLHYCAKLHVKVPSLFTHHIEFIHLYAGDLKCIYDKSWHLIVMVTKCYHSVCMGYNLLKEKTQFINMAVQHLGIENFHISHNIPLLYII